MLGVLLPVFNFSTALKVPVVKNFGGRSLCLFLAWFTLFFSCLSIVKRPAGRLVLLFHATTGLAMIVSFECAFCRLICCLWVANEQAPTLIWMTLILDRQ